MRSLVLLLYVPIILRQRQHRIIKCLNKRIIEQVTRVLWRGGVWHAWRWRGGCDMGVWVRVLIM